MVRIRLRLFTLIPTLVIVAVSGGITPQSVYAEASNNANPLRESLTSVHNGNALPGISGAPGAIGMSRNGDNAQYEAVGFSDMWKRVPADPSMTFRAGSNTKTFVAAVMLQLEAEGVLSLDDTVDKWLPGLVNSGGNDGTRITLRQLLNHTSGLAEYSDDAVVALTYAADLNPRHKWKLEDLVRIATKRGQISAPGTAFKYSNTNYLLTGMVIAAATGNNPATEVRQRIIEPLGLANTSFPIDDPKLSGNWMHGYTLFRDISISATPQLYQAAGAMISTLDDLATFHRALLSGQVLAPAQLDAMKAMPGIDNAQYGLGLVRFDTPCGEAWGHSGAALGYESYVLSSADGQRQVAVADNEFHLVVSKVSENLYHAAVDSYCSIGQ